MSGERSGPVVGGGGASPGFGATPPSSTLGHCPSRCRRAAWWFEFERPALVLGSAQPTTDVDAAAVARAGVEVVRRRSGGGAVLLTPGDAVWVDLLIPASDPLWQDDVGLATHWVGRLWAGVLRRARHRRRGPHRRDGAGCRGPARACFAGLGRGGHGRRSQGGRDLATPYPGGRPLPDGAAAPLDGWRPGRPRRPRSAGGGRAGAPPAGAGEFPRAGRDESPIDPEAIWALLAAGLSGS